MDLIYELREDEKTDSYDYYEIFVWKTKGYLFTDNINFVKYIVRKKSLFSLETEENSFHFTFFHWLKWGYFYKWLKLFNPWFY